MTKKELTKLMVLFLVCSILLAGSMSINSYRSSCITTSVYCESYEELEKIADILAENNIVYSIKNETITFEYDEHYIDIFSLKQ